MRFLGDGRSRAGFRPDKVNHHDWDFAMRHKAHQKVIAAIACWRTAYPLARTAACHKIAKRRGLPATSRSGGYKVMTQANDFTT
jgi:hypothetical protein